MLSIESESFIEERVPVLDPISEALRELIDLAENTQSIIAERDLMAVGHKELQKPTECEIAEDQASGSGTCNHDTPQNSDVS